ncbi:MAG: PQQ-binding-like beta-propeller repeat protein [Phycisphaerae bacterium]|nr:PQQ-binding-like beta-propeller repeat protein [Phycisphaerae bacterium]
METARRFIALIVSVHLLTSAAFADELWVGPDHAYATIQSAIAAAADGDVVIVAPGVYRQRLNFAGKAITVRSTDPEDWNVVTATVIDAQYNGSCVTFNQGETGDSVLEGFTLTRGTGTQVAFDGQPRQFNGVAGGGIYCWWSSPTVRRCNIVVNGYSGPTSSDAIVEFGGGIALVGDSHAVIEGCVVADNIARRYGPGIIVLGAASSSPTIANCTVANNKISWFDYNLRHTYYDVDCWRTAATLENTIIWSEQNRSLFVSDPLRVRYCCVRSVFQFDGNYPIPAALPVVPAAEQGIVYGRPGFVAAYDRYDAERPSDYRLRSDSVCVDRGDPAFDGAGKTDMDGQSRVMGARVDIGADEVMPMLTVERPAGGEIWAAGSRHEIRWRRSHADRVFINNADFNSSDMSQPSPAHISDSRAAAGWQVLDAAGIAYGCQFKPTPGVGKAYGYSFGGDLYQLSNDVYKPRTRYTLTVRVGRRSDWAGEITNWTAVLWGEVWSDWDRVVARTDQRFDGVPAKGEWITATATVTTGEAGVDPVVGRRIGVRLNSPPRVYWDSVEIAVCPLEPETVDISYSTDGGATWELVEAGFPDVGTYLWTLPQGVDSQDCRVKVVPSVAAGEIAYAGDAAFAMVPYAAGEPVAAEWPTLGGDGARQGLSEHTGPKLGSLKWAHGTAGPVYHGVVIGDEGQVYYVTANGVLTAINAVGSTLWECALGDGEILELNRVDGQTPPGSPNLSGTWDALIVSARVPQAGFLGDIVSLGSTVVRVVERNGVPVFGFRNFGVAGNVFGATPANTQAGTELTVVVPHGARRWSDVQLYIDGVPEPRLETYGDAIQREITSVGFLCSDAQVKVYRGEEDVVSHPTVGPDGTIYVGFGDVLYAVGADGQLRWKYETGAFVYSCPAVDGAGRVFFGSADGTVYALAGDGSELWRFDVPGPGAIGGSVLQPPSIGKDGSVYVGGMYKSTLYALDPVDAGIRWQSQLTAGGDAGGSFMAAPVVGPDGTLYVTMVDDPHLYALDPADGRVKWATNIAHEPELVGYWKFNEGSGTHAYDSSTYGRSAMYGWPSPTNFTWVPGVLGGAILRGSGNVSRFTWEAGTKGRSVCVWVKGRPFGEGIVRWDTQTDDWTITLESAGRVRVAANGGYMVGKRLLRDHQWHHVAVVLAREGAGAAGMADMKIYVDGRLDAAFGDNGGYAANTSTLRIDADTYGSLIISESGLPVDDLRLYETALSESQIRELMWDETAPTFTQLREPTSSAAKGLYSWTEVAIAADGTIYAGFDDPYLRAINPDGTVRWVKHLACGGNYSLTVGADGLVYAAGADGVLYVIRPDGKLISRFDAGAQVVYTHTTYGVESKVCELTGPVVTADGTVYVGDVAGRVLAVSADGPDDRPDVLTCQKLPFDINGDCLVNLADFAILASEWLNCTYGGTPCTDPAGPWRYVPGYIAYPDMQYLDADVNRDMYVDFNDVEWLMQRWLTGADLFE